MKIFILASGLANRWNGKVKQLSDINGEVLIKRTLRQLEGHDVTVVTHRSELHAVCSNCLVPENKDTLLNTIMSTVSLWDGNERVVFMLGDVVWTDEGIKKVLAYADKNIQFFSSCDETFAISFPSERFKYIQKAIQGLIDRGLKGTTWQLYRHVWGGNLDKHVLETKYRTPIEDKTDDIDFPKEYEDKVNKGYFKGM